MDVATAVNARGGMGRHDFESETFIAPIQHAMPNQGPGRMADDAARMGMVRRLTPTECERLQGFLDGYTLVSIRGRPAADSPRYRALGNSMAVPVMRWIGERIDQVEAITPEAP